jgi:hypothetical protein
MLNAIYMVRTYGLKRRGIHHEKATFPLGPHYFDYPLFCHPSRQFGYEQSGELLAEVFVFAPVQRLFEIG